jgi:hypothetical protein
MAVAGVLLELRRFVVYAAILLTAGGLEHLGLFPAGTGILAAGILVLLVGGALLTRFLHRHPLPDVPGEVA